ncbi:MAG TPA: YbjQ family protein [Ignavibacteriales bacterium]|nr:YbjQ family protein [Ignavibacteriales bacterium]HOL81347.1 YbjQ family protein [Ignavibacteriales bacterium]HOM65463.1 YbjQ family protein [Ignavibacteriales bacterium]HPD68279.1 YbjQ family protein [Ignavibacteriales bacterium]HPP33884.1 YbjQ family protein [Ignavibacteriales bacterium]
MIIVTTNSIDNKEIVEYCGIVSGNAILGTNILKDLFTGIKDLVGGRMNQLEDVLDKAGKMAIDEMTEKAEKLNANAIVGVQFNYNSLGQGTMLMVNVTGTAVKIK